MTDWNLLAEAQGAGIPAEELARVTAPLAALEAAFRPLVADLAEGLEPAIVFDGPRENAR